VEDAKSDRVPSFGKAEKFAWARVEICMGKSRTQITLWRFILTACALGHIRTAACTTGRSGIWALRRAWPRLCLRGGDNGAESQGNTMWIVVHGVESDAVTLAWEKVDGAQCYEVQLKVGEEDFKTVSDKLSSTMVSFCVGNSPPRCASPLCTIHCTQLCPAVHRCISLLLMRAAHVRHTAQIVYAEHAIPWAHIVPTRDWRAAGTQEKLATKLGAPSASSSQKGRGLGRLQPCALAHHARPPRQASRCPRG